VPQVVDRHYCAGLDERPENPQLGLVFYLRTVSVCYPETAELGLTLAIRCWSCWRIDWWIIVVVVRITAGLGERCSCLISLFSFCIGSVPCDTDISRSLTLFWPDTFMVSHDSGSTYGPGVDIDLCLGSGSVLD